MLDSANVAGFKQMRQLCAQEPDGTSLVAAPGGRRRAEIRGSLLPCQGLSSSQSG